MALDMSSTIEYWIVRRLKMANDQSAAVVDAVVAAVDVASAASEADVDATPADCDRDDARIDGEGSDGVRRLAAAN